MTAPQVAGSGPQPAPGDDPAVQHVADLLLAGGAAVLTAAAIYRLLRRLHRPVSLTAVTLATVLTTRGTNHEPRMVGSSAVARAQRTREAYFRAAYLINAATRITTSMAGGTPGRDALRRERVYWRAHEKARQARMQGAAHVARKAEMFGPLLGWYTTRDDRTTPECRAANGTNFSALRPPVIGWPRTLHGGTCRCDAGPPFANGRTTDEATGHLHGLTHEQMGA